ELRFTPPDVGLFRYNARLETVPGEVIPTQNNSTDFALNVRQEKTKILFLDWKPRWETRFAMNILRNLDYVNLNSIVVIVGKDAILKRGVEKGSWPENLPAL